MLFILGLIFLFIVPPLGVILLILAIIVSILKGSTKAVVGTGKVVSKAIVTRKCPHCRMTINKKASTCPHCHQEIGKETYRESKYDESNDFEENLKEQAEKDIYDSDNNNEQYIIGDYIENINKTKTLYENKLYTKEEFEKKRNVLVSELIDSLLKKKSKEEVLVQLLPLLHSKHIQKEDLEKIKLMDTINIKTIGKEKIFDILMEKLDDIVYLYDNKIYNDIEYKEIKKEWINNLKGYQEITERKDDILLRLVPLIQKNYIAEDEMDEIKYIITGRFFEDIREKQEEEKIKARQEKQEIFKQNKEKIKGNIKNTQKQIGTSVNEVKTLISKFGISSREYIIGFIKNMRIFSCKHLGKKIFIPIAIVLIILVVGVGVNKASQGFGSYEIRENDTNTNVVGNISDDNKKSDKDQESIDNDNRELDEEIKNLKLYKDELQGKESGREEVKLEEDTIGGYTYVKRRVKEVKSFEEQVVLSKNDIIFPGAIFKGDTLHTGEYVPINLNRRPIKISTSFQGNVEITDVLDNPRNISNARETINKLLTQEGLEGTADIYFTTDEIYSEEQMAFSLGAGIGFKGINVGFNFSPSETKKTSKLVSQFVQRYYTISADYPNSPANFFADNVTKEDISSICGEYMPVYVSKVIYGRRGLFMIQSEYSAEEVKRALNVGYNVAGSKADGNAEDTYRNVFQKSHIMFHILGGNEETAAGVVEGYDSFLKHIKSGGKYSGDSRGEIIGFELRYLHDNSIAKVVLDSEYDIVEKIPREKNIKYAIDHIKFTKNNSTSPSFWMSDGVIYVDDSSDSMWEIHSEGWTKYTIIGEENKRFTIDEIASRGIGDPVVKKHYKSNFDNMFFYDENKDEVIFNINVKGIYYDDGGKNSATYNVQTSLRAADIENEELFFIECNDGTDFSPWEIVFAIKPYVTYK